MARTEIEYIITSITPGEPVMNVKVTFYTFVVALASGGCVGYAVAQLVEALRYKPEGRGFDSR